MLRKSIILLSAVLLLTTSCRETLCENGFTQFCEDTTPTTLGKWTEKQKGPDGDEMVAFAVGNKGYVGGGGLGFPPVFDPLNKFYSYDPLPNKWDSIAPLPGSGRLSAVAFSTSKKGYVGGGYYWTPSETGGTEFKLTDFYEYDPIANSWTKKADLPGGAGTYAGFGILDKGYVLSEGKLWEYDPSANSWIPKADCPVNNGLTFSIGAFGYVLNINKLWEYNTLTNTWKAKADSPENASGATFSTKTRGYLINSERTFEYNPIKNIWIKKADTPKIKEYDEQGASLRIQYAFGTQDKGYLGIEYRSRAMFFFEFDPKQ